MAVEETTREGYPALRLTSGDLAATFVPQLGMIGAGLEHRGEELLGQRKGLPAYEAKGSTMGIPLLYPWANRLSGLAYQVAWKQVVLDPDSPLVRLDPNGLPIHGLLAANPHWRVTEREAGSLEASLDFGAHPELLEAFPFPHSLRLSIALTPDALTISTTVDADQGSPVPVSFGFHPYLTLPHVPREEWHVELPVKDHLLLDDRGIPTGASEPAEALDGSLDDRTFDDAYAGITGDFVLSGGGRRTSVAFAGGYDYAQVYAPGGQSLICFEPMTAPTNALVTGAIPVVEPGATTTAAFRIEVSGE
ncbi:MAG: aldose 1-epimerase [Thermoleophilaceae bacterium]|nr:aldose 1-epimerase [Thermoleophilaceae bacterium]